MFSRLCRRLIDNVTHTVLAQCIIDVKRYSSITNYPPPNVTFNRCPVRLCATRRSRLRNDNHAPRWKAGRGQYVAHLVSRVALNLVRNTCFRLGGVRTFCFGAV